MLVLHLINSGVYKEVEGNTRQGDWDRDPLVTRQKTVTSNYHELRSGYFTTNLEGEMSNRTLTPLLITQSRCTRDGGPLIPFSEFIGGCPDLKKTPKDKFNFYNTIKSKTN